MILRFNFKIPTSPVIAETNLKSCARLIVFKHQLTPDELKLEKVLKIKYKLDFKTACIVIINSAKIYEVSQLELILKILDPKIEKMARLIMFGNGVIKGSSILKVAFGNSGKE